jgi:hypothetical protein
MKRATLAFLAAAATTPACAATTFDAYFAKADGGHPCYARTYTDAHMVEHPVQTVTRIEIDYDPKNPDGVANRPEKFELGFGFMLKHSHAWYTNVAECSARSTGFDCSLESDGGAFRLTPQDGMLTLMVVNRGGTDAAGDQINVEGTNDFAGFGKPGGDDLVFSLTRSARSVCDASTQ